MATDTRQKGDTDQLSSAVIDYIDKLTASIGRTAALLRAAAEACPKGDRESLLFLALETTEAGEAATREFIWDRKGAPRRSPNSAELSR